MLECQGGAEIHLLFYFWDEKGLPIYPKIPITVSFNLNYNIWSL
jgi:hypothetical protein